MFLRNPLNEVSFSSWIRLFGPLKKSVFRPVDINIAENTEDICIFLWKRSGKNNLSTPQSLIISIWVVPLLCLTDSNETSDIYLIQEERDNNTWSSIKHWFIHDTFEEVFKCQLVYNNIQEEIKSNNNWIECEHVMIEISVWFSGQVHYAFYVDLFVRKN